jgi:hypothetical protein
LLPARDPRREQARQLRQQCQRYATLEGRLPAVLRRTENLASAAEQMEFFDLCLRKKHYAAASHFASEAFAADPKLAEAVPAGLRYSAACAAALAGCGHGQDADKLDDWERARWRRQALDWLRQDLAWWIQSLDSGNAQTNVRARQMMQHWLTDGDFAGVRGRDALAQLPKGERQDWESLWSDVDALLRRASPPE